MNEQKFFLQLHLELFFLGLICIAYIVIRYIVIRRPITHREFETWFLGAAAVFVVAAVIYLMKFY